ncbi:MAG TPA: hypothetical protein DEP45_04880 [Armatimonadetes bacterium]|nr:hypothetical protein [Armatimonadota bacterium]
MRPTRGLPPTVGQQRIMVGGASPAGKRHREQAKRRSMCCCSLMLLASLAVAVLAFRGLIGAAFSREPEAPEAPKATFPLELQTGQSAYMRYDLIPVTVRVVDARGNPTSDNPPDVVVTRDGEIVETIGHFPEQVKLRWNDQQKAWAGYWPPGWNPDPGIYRIEAKLAIDPAQWSWEQARLEEEEGEITPEGETWAISQAVFELRAREKPALAPGMCVATWEFDYRDTFSGPDGSNGDWRKLFDWIEYMGADTFWFRGGLTEPNGDQALTLEQPFKQVNLDAISMFGSEAHRRGIKFGTWATAYATYGNRERKPDYDYSLDVSRSSGSTKPTEYISLLDERRINHLAAFFKMVQESENVDMAGLDYMRTNPGSGGYELAEPFAREMPVELPDNWDSMSANARLRYVAVKIEEQWRAHQDPEFFEAWNWWRAHLGAQVVRQIIEKSGITKPTWIFVLSWLHGVQHGQDPLMFTDAGVTLLAPMLYQVDGRPMFDTLVKDWHGYIRAGQANIVPGDQVDFHWHQKLRDPPAPAEMNDRIVTAHRQLLNGGVTEGAFWHDINRAASKTNLGPYSGREWALAGAAAFSTVRDSWKVYPLHAELTAPNSAAIASQFTVKVKLTNPTKQQVSGIRVSVCDTPGMVGVGLKKPAAGEPFGESYTDVAALAPGQSIEVPVTVRISQGNSERLNKTMLALRVTWAEGEFEAPVRNELPRMIVLMKYIQGQ